MLKRILFVDDEVQILKSFIRLFLDTEYEIITAQSGNEALSILENEKVDLIVSDMKMPNMTGYELLSEVKERFPEIIRIILSGFSDERVVFDALQKNIAKLYMLKPWENKVLINTLEKVFYLENSLKSSNVLKIINNAEELPTIRTPYKKIISTIEKEQEIYKIVDVMEQDASITRELLHIINSSYYGVKTGSVKRAVSYLGVDNIKNIVIAAAFIDSLTFDFNDNEIIETLWQQSFISNRILNIIYNEFLNIKTPETAMVAGLLNNVGIIFMIHCFKEKYAEIFDEVEVTSREIIDLEEKSFGANHQEVGAYLLRLWDIPLSTIEAALYHHNPFDENIINKQIVCAVHISGKYAWNMLNKNHINEFDERVFDVLDIDKEKFEDRLKETLELSGIINM